jgi:flagellar biosynthesis protein FliQ
MNSLEIMEIGRLALIVFFKVSMPIMIIALVVGLVISLLQALTQIQEQTLVFVPKVLIVFIALVFLMPFMLETMKDFNDELSRRIINIGKNESGD